MFSYPMRKSFVLTALLAIASGLAPSCLAPVRSVQSVRRVPSMSEVPQGGRGATSRRQALLAGAGLSLASAVAPPALAAAEAAAPVAKGGYPGVYSDPKHPKGYRVIREVKAGSAAIELQDEPKAEVFNVAGTSKFDQKSGETTIQIGASGDAARGQTIARAR